MIEDKNIIEIKDHLKTVIEHTTKPKDLEILVFCYKNIDALVTIDNNIPVNEKNRVYDGDKEYDKELNYTLGFEDGKKSCLSYLYNELENHIKTEKDFAFINNDCKAREDNKLIINRLEYFIKKLGEIENE